MQIKTIEGDMTVRSARFGIAVSRFNSFVVESLLSGALDTLRRHGAQDQDIEIVRVPGAYELPLVVQRMATAKRYDAIIALGAVIRGGTPHFDYVAGECARGLAEAATATGVPIGFGVLTVNNVEQALARAQEGESNKGREAMLAALEVAGLIEQLGR